MRQAYSFRTETFEVIPLLLVAAAWYLLITTLFSIGQQRLERHFGLKRTALTVGESDV